MRDAGDDGFGDSGAEEGSGNTEHQRRHQWAEADTADRVLNQPGAVDEQADDAGGKEEDGFFEVEGSEEARADGAADAKDAGEET